MIIIRVSKLTYKAFEVIQLQNNIRDRNLLVKGKFLSFLSVNSKVKIDNYNIALDPN